MDSKLNCYYIGFDRHHCSSCSEPGDYSYTAALLPWSKDEMMENLRKFGRDKISSDWGNPEIIPHIIKEFLKRAADFGIMIRSYGESSPPNMEGHLFGEEIDMGAIKPEDFLTEERLSEILKERERINKERLEKQRQQIKEDKEREERLLYATLKNKYGNKAP